MRVLCRQPWRSRMSPAAHLTPRVGPPKTDMLHFTVARTRIRRKFCTRTHENARPNHQKETEASIVGSPGFPGEATTYSESLLQLFRIGKLNYKENSCEPVLDVVALPGNPGEPNRCTPEYEIFRPNHQKYTEASIVVHLKTKNPVRTIIKKHQASIVYTHARKHLSEPSEREKSVHHFRSKNEKSRPNHQKEAPSVNDYTRTHERARPNRQIRTPASIVLHLNAKYPVRTVRYVQRRQ